jgi:hypothetical protein
MKKGNLNQNSAVKITGHSKHSVKNTPGSKEKGKVSFQSNKGRNMNIEVKTSKSSENTNLISSNLRSSEKILEHNNKFISQKNLMQIKPSLQFSQYDMPRINSFNPFPKVNPEFYSENKDPLWHKELQKVRTEVDIHNKSKNDKKFIEKNNDFFCRVRI